MLRLQSNMPDMFEEPDTRLAHKVRIVNLKPCLQYWPARKVLLRPHACQFPVLSPIVEVHANRPPSRQRCCQLMNENAWMYTGNTAVRGLVCRWFRERRNFSEVVQHQLGSGAYHVLTGDVSHL